MPLGPLPPDWLMGLRRCTQGFLTEHVSNVCSEFQQEPAEMFVRLTLSQTNSMRGKLSEEQSHKNRQVQNSGGVGGLDGSSQYQGRPGRGAE